MIIIKAWFEIMITILEYLQILYGHSIQWWGLDLKSGGNVIGTRPTLSKKLQVQALYNLYQTKNYNKHLFGAPTNG